MNETWHLDEERALDYLRAALPLADRMILNEDALLGVVRHALARRRELPWGASIPEDVFLPFVLFPRVNNEDAAPYHALLWERIGGRLAGLGMAQAAMVVNRWCYENATYQSTDGRTANALTVLRRGFGRCGEESVLLVSALRACGLPARQVYSPLWAHCDDNHAWVEVWADGEWHYMGACEPELSLDSGWFTAAASKAMLVHTRAWGLLPSGERAEGRDGEAYILNRTAAYAKTALLKLRVTEHGRPRAGLRVDFELANMAAYGPINRKLTDADGRTELLTGLGTLHVWITDGQRFLEKTVDIAAKAEYELDFARATPFTPGSATYTQRPPRESRIQPADFPIQAVQAHERWLAEAGAAREARFAMPDKADALLVKARGNRDVVEAFLRDGRFEAQDARTLLEALRDKDLADATEPMLADALEGALPWKQAFPRDVWVKHLLCPRVADEMLRPFRRWARQALPRFTDAAAVWQFLLERVRVEDLRPASLIPDLCASLEAGVCSPAGRDILFVALCRACGIPARLDPVTGEKQYFADGGFRGLSDEAPAKLCLSNATGQALVGGVHFSLAMLRDGAFHPLELYGTPLEDDLALSLPAGRYRVMTAARQIDGSLEGRLEYLELAPGEERRLALSLPEDRTGEKLLRAPLPALETANRAGQAVALPKSLAGRCGIVAVIAPGQEPTEHFLNELLENREALARRGAAVRLLVGDWPEAENDKLARVLSAIADAECLARPEKCALRRWRELMNAGELRLPLAVAVDEGGRGLFAFVNYNVGSVATLIKILDAR